MARDDASIVRPCLIPFSIFFHLLWFFHSGDVCAASFPLCSFVELNLFDAVFFFSWVVPCTHLAFYESNKNKNEILPHFFECKFLNARAFVSISAHFTHTHTLTHPVVSITINTYGKIMVNTYLCMRMHLHTQYIYGARLHSFNPRTRNVQISSLKRNWREFTNRLIQFNAQMKMKRLVYRLRKQICNVSRVDSITAILTVSV